MQSEQADARSSSEKETAGGASLVVELPTVTLGPDDRIINIRGAALNYAKWDMSSDGAFCSDKSSPGDG